jgi:hypothetical protein
MILHPGVLALLLGSSLVLCLMVAASGVGLRVLAGWDFASSSEEQLALERRTSLISSLAGWALGFEVVAGLLLVYTLEDVHGLFVGAMCATGSLNANPVGWTLLAVKLLLVALSALWLVLNGLDQRAGDFPIIRLKYLGLLLLTPLVAVDLILQIRYFGGLDPEVITSCCGSLFSESGSGVGSDLAGLPVTTMMWVLYLSLAAFVATGVACLRSPSRFLRPTLAVMSVVVLGAALVAVVSFISLYVYQLPTHHCPFDMLQAQYRFIGYALYASLFAGAFFGLLPGLAQPLRRVPSLSRTVVVAEARWLRLSLLSMLVFTGVASWPVLFGELSLVGY